MILLHINSYLKAGSIRLWPVSKTYLILPNPYKTFKKVNIRFWPEKRISLSLPRPERNFKKLLKIRYSQINQDGITYPPRKIVIQCKRCEEKFVNLRPVYKSTCNKCIKVIQKDRLAVITVENVKNIYWI